MNINEIVDQRDKTYGGFEDQSTLSQNLKRQVYAHPKYHELSDPQKESIDMILHKIARIVNGDKTYADNFYDIAGYSMLIVRQLERK